MCPDCNVYCIEGFLISQQDQRPCPLGQGHCLKVIYMSTLKIIMVLKREFFLQIIS